VTAPHIGALIAGGGLETRAWNRTKREAPCTALACPLRHRVIGRNPWMTEGSLRKQAAGVAASLGEPNAARVQSLVPAPSAIGDDDAIAAVELDMNLGHADRGYLPSGLEDEPCAVRLAPGDALVVEGDERP
jgi:hypothetical protein